MAKNTNVANTVGKGLAHLQHTLDRFYDWGFRQLKEAGKEPRIVEPEPEEGWKRTAKRLGRKTAGFLGSAGDAYYRTYEKLKRDGEE